MIIYKNIKLFTTSLLYLVVSVQAYSISQIGDIKIEITDEKWICDMIECPLESERCVVSKSNSEDPSVLKRVDICYSKDNIILAEKTEASPTNPNFRINQYINSNRSGSSTFTSDASATNLDQKTINEKLNQQMANVQSRLENMHRNIDREIQTQMNSLDDSLKKMRFKLANMFDYSD